MSTSSLPDPVGAIERAITLARTTGRPATVRVHHALSGSVDPWALLGHGELATRQVLAWADDSEDRCFLAVEVLQEFELHGDSRFDEAGRIVAAARANCVDVPWVDDVEVHEDVPLVVGGFAFAPRGRAGDGAWSGWTDGTLWVPHALVHRYAGRTVLVVTEQVGAKSDVHEVLDELSRNVRRVALAIARPHPARPSEPALGGPTAGRDATDHDVWVERVTEAGAAMSDDVFDKVVLARSETWETADGRSFDPYATAVALRERQARCTTFAFVRADGSAFVGATPELLARLDKGVVSTTALAGTARRELHQSDEETAKQLLESAKDRHEQQLVAGAIENSLGPLTEHLHIPGVPEIVTLADVLHLETRIQGRLSADHGLFELIERLHPTPAVGGLPRRPALEWMQEHEGLHRGWYAAPVGWVDVHGNGTFVVAIRSVLLRNGTATTFAGCGLVPDSDAEAEWRETLSKLEAVRHGLAVTRR